MKKHKREFYVPKMLAVRLYYVSLGFYMKYMWGKFSYFRHFSLKIFIKNSLI